MACAQECARATHLTRLLLTAPRRPPFTARYQSADEWHMAVTAAGLAPCGPSLVSGGTGSETDEGALERLLRRELAAAGDAGLERQRVCFGNVKRVFFGVYVR